MTSSDALSRRDKLKISRLRAAVLQWAEGHGRSFPWRDDCASKYQRVCSEVLLQRTRAETVADFYPYFFAQYPDWKSIAHETIERLEQVLRPIGLWQRRAKALHGLASYVVRVGGRFPITSRAYSEVPAVGQYVANAILLFHHGRRKPLLDVNMARLIERYVRPRRLADIRFDPWLQSASHWLVRRDNPVAVNWAVLDFGATVCTARFPKCGACPLVTTCPNSVLT